MMQDFEKFNNYARRCFKEDPPPCRCVCPFKLNIRSFTGKVERGRIDSAYREYRNAVVFPEIVSRVCDAPCEEVCVRKKNGEPPVSLRGIEAACVSYSKDRKPIRYDLPKKNEKIAVIGAGPSGLACAVKLAARNFPVTMIFAEAETGGSLAESLAVDVYRGEIDAELQGLPVELRPGTVVREIAPLFAEGFAAVYIATGMGGEDFGLREGLDTDSLGSALPGVFIGGEILGASKARAIENGSRASKSIEKYLQVGAMDGMAETFESWPVNEQFYRPVAPAPPALSAGPVSKEGAIEEACRCRDCECSLCIDACPMLESTKRTPKKVADDVTVSVYKVEQQTRRVANRLMNACNICGLCREVCPVDVPMGDIMLEARKDVFEQGGQPPAFHDHYIRDMLQAQSDEAFFAYPGSARYMFFPGCQTGASLPDYVTKPYETLREAEGDAGILLSCCGAPAEWAGDQKLADEILSGLRGVWEKAGKPTFVCSCMNCMKRLAEKCPDIPAVSWFEWADKSGVEIFSGQNSGNGDKGPVYVFDPCAARYDEGAREAVRNLLDKAGIERRSGDMSGVLAECCGFGGHIYASNPDLYGKIVDLRTSESDLPYLAYCSNCRDAFAASGKNCRHIFDVIYGGPGGDREAPRISQRQMNRRYLKSRVARICASDRGSDRGTYNLSHGEPSEGAGWDVCKVIRPPVTLSPDDLSEGGGWDGCQCIHPPVTLSHGEPSEGAGWDTKEPSPCVALVTPPVNISDELLRKMERELISEDDVRRIIGDAENTDMKHFDAETGHFIAHGAVGVSTCWAVYAKEDDGFSLVNVYSHRMKAFEEA